MRLNTVTIPIAALALAFASIPVDASAQQERDRGRAAGRGARGDRGDRGGGMQTQDQSRGGSDDRAQRRENRRGGDRARGDGNQSGGDREREGGNQAGGDRARGGDERRRETAPAPDRGRQSNRGEYRNNRGNDSRNDSRNTYRNNDRSRNRTDYRSDYRSDRRNNNRYEYRNYSRSNRSYSGRTRVLYFGWGSGYRYGSPYSGRVYGNWGRSGYGSRVYYGDVRLQVKPRDAAVYVDGYYAGVVDDFDGFFQRLTLEVGPHEIEIVAQGLEPVLYNVYVDPARTVDVHGDLYFEERR